MPYYLREMVHCWRDCSLALIYIVADGRAHTETAPIIQQRLFRSCRPDLKDNGFVLPRLTGEDESYLTLQLAYFPIFRRH